MKLITSTPKLYLTKNTEDGDDLLAQGEHTGLCTHTPPPPPNSHHGLLLHWLGEAATPRALVLLCHLQAQVVQHQHRMRACVRQREGMGKHLMRVTSDWDVSRVSASAGS